MSAFGIPFGTQNRGMDSELGFFRNVKKPEIKHFWHLESLKLESGPQRNHKKTGPFQEGGPLQDPKGTIENWPFSRGSHCRTQLVIPHLSVGMGVRSTLPFP